MKTAEFTDKNGKTVFIPVEQIKKRGVVIHTKSEGGGVTIYADRKYEMPGDPEEIAQVVKDAI